MKSHTLGFRLALAAAVVAAAAGCDDFLEVRNPAVVEATAIDPVADAPVLAASAFQNFATYYGSAVVYSGWFTSEIWVGDTFPTRNEYGRRLIDDRNATHNGDIWFPLSRSVSSAENVLDLAGGAAGAEQSVHIARAAMTSGFSILLMAEHFCRGTIASGGQPGPELSTEQMLNLAVERLTRAIAVGTAASTATGPGTTAATRAAAGNIANAARVGLGRAHLQAGRHAEAIAAVNAVPAAFRFDVPFVDDAGNRGRLGNGVFFFSGGGAREAIVVPPVYRQMGVNLDLAAADRVGDPRIPFNDAGRDAQDATLRLWNQQKYPNYASPIRLASGLEARYIVAEAQLKTGNPAAALTLIGERRTAGQQDAFAGTGDAAILAELMAQRSRDFWLEGKRMGDFRRNPGSVPNVLGPNDAYYKPAVGTMGDQTCFPIPAFEFENR
jgi:starch-binding outer membrane protein, SusD/RagB family